MAEGFAPAPARRPVIAGVAELPLVDGRLPAGETPLGLSARVASRALADAGQELADVDGLLSAGDWGLPGAGTMLVLSLAEYLGIAPTFADGTNTGGSSFEAHIAHAALAIAQGYCETALIVYASVQRSAGHRSLGGRPADSIFQWQTPWGLPVPVGAYALAAARHMHVYGTTSEQLAEIAVATRRWAQLNPAAFKRDPLSVEDVLASPLISDPLRRLDCCLVTDGAGAVVITTAERARDAGRQEIAVRGFGEAHTHNTIASMADLARFDAAARSGARAMAMAGVGPGDVDVAQIYDSFTITVLMTLEALGFCAPGEGGDFVAGQRTAPGGGFPMNTNGGGLSALHPGMYGIFLLVEAVRQLRCEAGERQVAGCETALVHGSGGNLSSAGTVILTRGWA
jgi:acetyl-CoA acetyltransferase